MITTPAAAVRLTRNTPTITENQKLLEDEESIVPKQGEYKITENDLRIYQKQKGFSGKTPDELLVRDGKVVKIIQEYKPSTSSATTQSNKIFNDIVKTWKLKSNYRNYGLKSSETKIIIRTNKNVDPNILNKISDDITSILDGKDPTILPKGYTYKDKMELIYVKNLIDDGKVELVTE